MANFLKKNNLSATGGAGFTVPSMVDELLAKESIDRSEEISQLKRGTAMKISVVISAYCIERANSVLDCIESLQEQTVQPSEVLLVLDPDPVLVDSYRSLVPDHVKIVVSQKFGLSNARNAGIENSAGDIVAFIDDDAFPKSDWIEKLSKNYSDPYVMSVGGFIQPSWQENEVRPSWFPEELDWVIGCSYKGSPEVRSLVRNAIGCNMSFRKTVFEKVGGFNTNLGRLGDVLLSGEEAEFSLKVKMKIPDSKIIFDPQAIVYHKVSSARLTVQYVIRRSYREGSSKALISEMASMREKSLTSESDYLRFILTNSIPSKLLKIYKISEFSQLLSLLASTISVLTGYFITEASLLKIAVPKVSRITKPVDQKTVDEEIENECIQ